VSRAFGTQVRSQKVPVFLQELGTNECPVSIITPESRRLVEIIVDAERVREHSGAVLFGQDSSQWDPRFFDAMQVIAEEQMRIQAEDEKVRQLEQG